MDLGLRGKVAVVTGASRGIGLAITQALVEEGCTSSPERAGRRLS
ncbi:SDR family NAD(P)-dependent oxidoreductase [Streptosporangium lutulentum]